MAVRTVRVVTIIAGGALAAMLLAANVTARRWSAYGVLPPETIAQHLIATLRAFVGDVAWMQGDIYLHRGLYADENRATYNVFTPYNPYIMFAGAHEHHEGCEREEHADGAPHVHMTAQHETQILPLFWLTAKADPANVQNWAVGGYWLMRVKMTNEAVRFLEDGLRHNPDSRELMLELGVTLYQVHASDAVPRITNLLWSALNGLTERIDRRRAYTYLGATLQAAHDGIALGDVRVRWHEEFTNEPPPLTLQPR